MASGANRGGESNTGVNVGTGAGRVFKQKNGRDLEFRRIRGLGDLTVTESGDDIDLTATGKLPTETITANAATLTVNKVFLIDNDAQRAVLTLPSTFAVGDRIEIVGEGQGGWEIAIPVGDTVYDGQTGLTSTSTPIRSSQFRSSITLVASEANGEWIVSARRNVTGLGIIYDEVDTETSSGQGAVLKEGYMANFTYAASATAVSRHFPSAWANAGVITPASGGGYNAFNPTAAIVSVLAPDEVRVSGFDDYNSAQAYFDIASNAAIAVPGTVIRIKGRLRANDGARVDTGRYQFAFGVSHMTSSIDAGRPPQNQWPGENTIMLGHLTGTTRDDRAGVYITVNNSNQIKTINTAGGDGAPEGTPVGSPTVDFSQGVSFEMVFRTPWDANTLNDTFVTMKVDGVTVVDEDSPVWAGAISSQYYTGLRPFVMVNLTNDWHIENLVYKVERDDAGATGMP